jgi:excisionase family DNA binding protein
MTTSHGLRRWPSLLTVDEAAQMVDRNPQTIRALIRSGELRARRSPGGTYVLAREDLSVDIAHHRHKVAEEYRLRGERRRTGRGA